MMRIAMNNTVLALWIAILTSSVVGCTPASEAPLFNKAGMRTVVFNVPDMMCKEGCAATVNDILSRQPGVKEVHVNFDAKKATVAIEKGPFDPELAIAALVDKGFDHSTLVTDKAAKPQAAGEAAD
jgi:copper chaperone CopZ